MFIAVEGHQLNTVAFGSGEATFVAHGGWVGNWELWQQPFELMQAQWRCLGFDHRGSGASSFPPEAITPEALVDDVFRVLDHFEVDSCVLAGESLGALTCIQAVLRDPSRFAGLVLVDGVPAASEQAMAPLVTGSRTDYAATVHAFIDACVPEADSEHIRRWGRQILLRADPEAAARMFEAHYEAAVAPDITQISVPTLLIHGENDAIVPVALAEAVTNAVPGAELVVLPDAGHVPTLTQPHEVVDAIDRWAASLPAPVLAPDRH
jgi:pimeloyl-ACP methyl ester carboxylesterase